MWPQWSRVLEALGRLRIHARRRAILTVGDPLAPDARDGYEWRDFLDPEPLYRVWGPLEGSPWEPFHAIPLFAALDRIPRDRIGPTSPEWIARMRPQATPSGDREEGGMEASLDLPAGDDGGVPGREDGPLPAGHAHGRWILPSHARFGAPPPAWIDPSTWVILDLPGPMVVEAAAWLVAGAGVQPVCTFDHWPHHQGVLQPEQILAELLRWASTMAAVRGRIAGDAPPLWVCDSERLGSAPGSPGEFDNRYFLDDSLLPGQRFLADAGIRRVIYLASRRSDIPLLDLEECFSELLAAGFSVDYALVSDPSFQLRPFAAPPTPRKPKRSSFHRSAAGGFGTDVPEPSSGGGGG